MAEDVGSEPTPRLTFRDGISRRDPPLHSGGARLPFAAAAKLAITKRGYFLVGSDAIEGLLDGAVPIALGDFSGPVRFPLPRSLSPRKN